MNEKDNIDPILDSIKEVFPHANMVVMRPVGNPAYIAALKNPPPFYCKRFCNIEDHGPYCKEQCNICTGIVKATREKNAT